MCPAPSDVVTGLLEKKEEMTDKREAGRIDKAFE